MQKGFPEVPEFGFLAIPRRTRDSSIGIPPGRLIAQLNGKECGTRSACKMQYLLSPLFANLKENLVIRTARLSLYHEISPSCTGGTETAYRS